MLGLFDSGSGGMNTVRYIKENMPTVDLVYKIDRSNAPYGTKNEQELIQIVENNISELIDRGADKVLIACCTAGTVYDKLSTPLKLAAIPIIKPISNRAVTLSLTRKIGVIATERTVSSHAFMKSMPECTVTEVAAQELVRLIDEGLNDYTITDKSKQLLKKIIRPFENKGIDTLILGCTHFPALKESFQSICLPIGITNIIDSAKTGAEAVQQTNII